jgi:phage terminase large subunit
MSSDNFADAVNRHQIAVRTDDMQVRELVTDDLEQMKRKDADKDGKLKIVPKDEVNEKLGRSRDHGDALMMRMSFELKPAGAGHIPPPTTLVKPYYEGLGV